MVRKDLEQVLRDYGQERFARSIARRIVEEREKNKITTTFQLIEIIKRAIPRKFQYGKTNFSTRTFQALRIAVNRELDNIQEVLPKCIEILSKGTRLIVISFHSLEDKIVKNFFRDNKEILEILTKKPISPSLEEINKNPRARSAKLRAVIKK